MPTSLSGSASAARLSTRAKPRNTTRAFLSRSGWRRCSAARSNRSSSPTTDEPSPRDSRPMTAHVTRHSGTLPAWAKVVILAVSLAALVHLLNTGYADWNAGADTVYVLVLLGLFFSREQGDDERVRELKLRSLSVAFTTGWAVTGALGFASYLQDRSAVPTSPSAYDAVFVMLVIANALLQWWRHADGRDADRSPS